MSVYTELSKSDMRAILRRFALGEYISHAGIAAGIENSNYFLDTTEGRFILTVFERMNPAELPYFMQLMHFLAGRGFPCPDVQCQRNGDVLFDVGGKRACIVSCLPGMTVDRLNERQLHAAGTMLARLHQAGSDFAEHRANPTCMRWICETGRALEADMAGRFGQEAVRLLTEELDWQQAQKPVSLPEGVIHADYFCDNILFSGNAVTGVIDFYYACDGMYAYDLAIAAHALAIDPQSADTVRMHALLSGYEAERRLSVAERAAWPRLLRLAAVRFWVSRLHDTLYPRQGAMVQIKDPEEYRLKLLWSRNYAG